jgi:hypothetical protein
MKELALQEHNELQLKPVEALVKVAKHTLEGMVKLLLGTYPKSPRRLARIDAAISILIGVAALLDLFVVVMNSKPGSDVEDLASDLVDPQLNEAEDRLNIYIESQRGDLTDAEFDEPKKMQEVLQERKAAEIKNAQLDEIARAYREAEAVAAENGGEIGEILPDRIRVKAKDPFELRLTKKKPMLS